MVRSEVDTEAEVAPETSGQSEGGVDVSRVRRALTGEAPGPETEAWFDRRDLIGILTGGGARLARNLMSQGFDIFDI